MTVRNFINMKIGYCEITIIDFDNVCEYYYDGIDKFVSENVLDSTINSWWVSVFDVGVITITI